MGLIVDTCVLIDAERKKQTVRVSIEGIFDITNELSLAISAITLAELAYGVARSREASIRRVRERFISDIRAQIPVYAVTDEIAIRAGLLDGELESTGTTVELADLLIGVTALQYGHGVLTNNVRHFRAIPGLHVVEL